MSVGPCTEARPRRRARSSTSTAARRPRPRPATLRRGARPAASTRRRPGVDGDARPVQDTLDVAVGHAPVRCVVPRRSPPPSTPAGPRLAELVSDVLARGTRGRGPEPGRRLGTGATPELRHRRGIGSRRWSTARRWAWPCSREVVDARGRASCTLRGRPGLAAARHRHPAAAPRRPGCRGRRAPTRWC